MRLVEPIIHTRRLEFSRFFFNLIFTDKERRDAILSLLIKTGAKMNVADRDGYTPLHSCVMQSVLGNFSLSTMELLVQAGSRLDSDNQPTRADQRLSINVFAN